MSRPKGDSSAPKAPRAPQATKDRPSQGNSGLPWPFRPSEKWTGAYHADSALVTGRPAFTCRYSGADRRHLTAYPLSWGGTAASAAAGTAMDACGSHFISYSCAFFSRVRPRVRRAAMAAKRPMSRVPHRWNRVAWAHARGARPAHANPRTKFDRCDSRERCPRPRD
jgi:hypothetical protein